MADTMIGKRVRFPPNPRWPDRQLEGVVQRRRKSPNANTLMATTGWLDVLCDDGKERSARQSVCEVI